MNEKAKIHFRENSTRNHNPDREKILLSDKQITLENTEGAIKNGRSRETGNID